MDQPKRITASQSRNFLGHPKTWSVEFVLDETSRPWFRKSPRSYWRRIESLPLTPAEFSMAIDEGDWDRLVKKAIRR